MKNGDADCESMTMPGRVDYYSDNLYAPYKNWCLKPMCVSVMDVNTPEEQMGIMDPPYHTHICMYSFACWEDQRTAVINEEEEITFEIRCASVNMLAASVASLLAIAYNF